MSRLLAPRHSEKSLARRCKTPARHGRTRPFRRRHAGAYSDGMSVLIAVLPYLIGLSLFAVVATLFTGLVSMTKGGEFNARYGNKLMRLRVILQALTIALFLTYVLLTQVS